MVLTRASMFVEATFDFVANGNNVERVFREMSSFRQRRNKLNMFNLFRQIEHVQFVSTLPKRRNVVRHRHQNPATLLSKINDNGNVEATFDFVEATFDDVERIVRLGTFENVVATLLLVWAGLKMFPGSR